jgi:hypothetical protein
MAGGKIMPTKTYKQLDAEAGRKLNKLNKESSKIAKKRLKEFTAISPANKKTKWYY